MAQKRGKVGFRGVLKAARRRMVFQNRQKRPQGAIILCHSQTAVSGRYHEITKQPQSLTSDVKHQEAAVPTLQVVLLLDALWEVERAGEIGGKSADHFAPANECLVLPCLVLSCLVVSDPSGAPSLDHSWCESGPSHSLSRACRSHAAFKYKRAAVTSRGCCCCCCRLFPVSARFGFRVFQGFPLAMALSRESRVCFGVFFFVFLKITRPARGFLPLLLGSDEDICLCKLLLKFCLFMKFSNNPQKIFYQGARWLILN